MKNCYIKIQLLFFIFVFLFLQVKCEAQSQYSDTLSKMEKSLFNMDYSSQSEDIRINRIEENVYGKCSTESASIRINKLSKDLSVDVIGQEIKPKKDSFLKDDEILVKQPNEDMDFSIINNFEKKVFHYEFKTLDISHRLSCLEGQVFKKDYSPDDLCTRLVRLNDAIMYNNFPTADSKIVQTPIQQQKLLTLEDKKERKLIPIPNSMDKQEQILDPRIQLASYEKTILKNSYPSEKNSDRLTRLETKIFNSTFLNDDEQTRLNRIGGASQARNSIKKYNSNRSSQRIATIIQFGTIFLIILPFLL